MPIRTRPIQIILQALMNEITGINFVIAYGVKTVFLI